MIAVIMGAFYGLLLITVVLLMTYMRNKPVNPLLLWTLVIFFMYSGVYYIVLAGTSDSLTWKAIYAALGGGSVLVTVVVLLGMHVKHKQGMREMVPYLAVTDLIVGVSKLEQADKPLDPYTVLAMEGIVQRLTTLIREDDDHDEDD